MTAAGRLRPADQAAEINAEINAEIAAEIAAGINASSGVGVDVGEATTRYLGYGLLPYGEEPCAAAAPRSSAGSAGSADSAGTVTGTVRRKDVDQSCA